MGELAALCASACWAVASIIFTTLSQRYGAMLMNTLKCVIALAMMFVTLAILEGTLWPALNDTELTALVASGLIGLTIGDTAFFSALTRIGPRRALLLMALVPPTTAVLAWPFLGEAVTLPMTLGMALTVGGVVWVVRERVPTVDETPDETTTAEAIGVVFGLVAVLCQSLGNVLTKSASAEISAIAISVVRVSAGALGLLAFLTIRGRLKTVVDPFREKKSAATLVFATLLGTYLGIWLLNTGLKYTSHTGVAATLSSTSPIWILPLAWLVLGERLSIRAIAGACVAVAGVAVLFAF